LVACVASKKFIKFLRKSLKEFGKKSLFSKSLKKKRKKRESLPSHLSAHPGLPAHQTLP
jgi:hypothetical protein